MTPAQIRTIQTAKKALRLGDRTYRTILRNSGGGVESSKDLTRNGFEQVMATFEEMGFQKEGDPNYWRDRITAGHQLSKADRMRYKVNALDRELQAHLAAGDVKFYSLPGIVSRDQRPRARTTSTPWTTASSST
jgi:hypothetical protein